MTAYNDLRRMFPGGYGKDQRARVLLSAMKAELAGMFDPNGSYDGWDVLQRIQAMLGEPPTPGICPRCFGVANHTLLDCINGSIPEEYRLHEVLE